MMSVGILDIIVLKKLKTYVSCGLVESASYTPFLQPTSCFRQAVYHHRPDPSTGPVWMISEFNECVVHNWSI